MTFKILLYIIFMALSTTNQAYSESQKKLPPCKDSPNCVSSQAEDAKHYIEPFIVPVENLFSFLIRKTGLEII